MNMNESRGVQSEKFLKDAARGPRRGLTADPAERKRQPIARGVLDYFPAALAAVAEVSRIGNDQHNPGEPMHWARGKSMDHADCIARHLIERGTRDTDGALHSAKLAWRALALLQTELEEEEAQRAAITTTGGSLPLASHYEKAQTEVLGDVPEVPAHELPVTLPTHELVQAGRRVLLLPTPEETLRRIRSIEHEEC